MKRFFCAFLLSLCAVSATLAANPLAIGPNGVDGEDLTGDAAHVWGDTRSVWMGTHGVAVWGTYGSEGKPRIMGAKFGPGGEPVGDPVRLVENLSETSFPGKSFVLSAVGNELLLVWQNLESGVLGRRLRPDLTWLDAEPSVLLPRGNLLSYDFYRFECAGTATSHGVVISHFYAGPPLLSFVRVGLSSFPTLETITVDIGDSQYVLSSTLAARANGFLMVWESQSEAGVRTVRARTTGLAGNATGPLQTLMTRANPGFDSAYGFLVSAAPLGDGYAVGWTYSQYTDGSGIPDFPREWRLVDAAGVPTAPAQELFPLDPLLAESTVPGPHSVIFENVAGGVLALSSTSVPGRAAPYRRVITRLLAANGTAGAVMDFGEVQAMVPEMIDVHDTPGGMLAVGNVRTNTIYSGRSAAVASVLTPARTWNPASHLLSRGIPEQQACAVATRGTDYLVVWQDGRDGHTLASEIRGRRFSIDGAPLGPSFRISDSPSDDISPAVAASDGKYLVAWTVNRADSNNEDVRAAIVSGTVSPSFPLAVLEDRQENGVSVAGGANGGFFAAWRSEQFTDPAAQDDIHGAWINAAGAVIPENGFPVGVSPGRERAVAVAASDSTYGVVWRVGNSERSNLNGAILPATPLASPVAPETISIATGSNAHAPEIAWSGNSYRVVWREAGLRLIRSAPLSAAGAVGATITIAENTFTLHEPLIVPWNAGGWQVFWYEPVLRNPLQNFVSAELTVNFAGLDATGQMGPVSRFAPRFIDHNTLAATPGAGNALFIVYPTYEGRGKEPERTGGLETVLLYPSRLAPDPQFTITSAGPDTTLKWKVDPWFPRDAGLIEAGSNLQQWAPVLQFPLVIPAGGSGNEAVVTFPALSGNRQFFRLNSSMPGSPQAP